MQIKTIQPQNYFCYTTKTTLNQINEVASREVEALYAQAQKLDLEPQGPLEFIYFDCTNDKDKEFTLEIALPVKDNGRADGKYQMKNFGIFKCMSYVHKGSLEDLYEVYDSIFENLHKEGQKPGNQVREVYLDYKSMDSADNVTEVLVGIN